MPVMPGTWYGWRRPLYISIHEGVRGRRKHSQLCRLTPRLDALVGSKVSKVELGTRL